MQYLKEMPNGNRVSVSADEWAIDRFDKGYTQIIATMGLLIYRIAGMKTRTIEPRLKFGGRDNSKSPVEYRGG